MAVTVTLWLAFLPRKSKVTKLLMIEAILVTRLTMLLRWLVMQNRCDEAQRVLEKVHSHSTEGHDRAHAELYQIQKQVALDRELDCTWVQLFRKPSYRKRAFLAMATTCISQFAGAFVINSTFHLRLLVGKY